MQFYKVVSYNLRVFKIIYNIFPFLCVATPIQYPLDCRLLLKCQKLECA